MAVCNLGRTRCGGIDQTTKKYKVQHLTQHLRAIANVEFH
jgi:hypothetical protein